jgi:hypothetical protein
MMKRMKKTLHRICEIAAVLLVAGALTACGQQQTRPSVSSPPCPPCPTDKITGLVARNQALEKDLTARTTEIADLEAKAVDQQFKILQKEATIKELRRRALSQQKRLDDAITEVVRTKSKLRSLESKAEAASAMAEAEIAVKAMKSRIASINHEQMAVYHKAEKLLKQSTQEFKARNFGGALYLAVQSKNQIDGVDDGLPGNNEIRPMAGEVAFDQPLPLKLTKNTNLREGPDLRKKVLATLKANTAVTGYSYKENWIRVDADGGLSGWVHRSLVMAR